MSFLYARTRALLTAAGAMAALIYGTAHVSAGNPALNLQPHSGPTTQSVRAFLIYWLPPGFKFDSSVANGVGNFQALLQTFVEDLAATSYFNILTQYPGTCGSGKCVITNVSGATALGGTWLDTRAYPNNKGSRANPLLDSDIQGEIQGAINQNHWTVDASSQFFVFTGAGVEECNAQGYCTFNAFCAYHSNFKLGGATAIYTYLSDASFNQAGCTEGVSAPSNGQIASDREVALMSHELFEAVTNSLGDAWYNDATGNEIGDNCNQQGVGVTLANSHIYVVQRQWSNHSSSCVLNY